MKTMSRSNKPHVLSDENPTRIASLARLFRGKARKRHFRELQFEAPLRSHSLFRFPRCIACASTSPDELSLVADVELSHCISSVRVGDANTASQKSFVAFAAFIGFAAVTDTTRPCSNSTRRSQFSSALSR